MYRALIFMGIITLSTCRPEIQSRIQQQEQQTTDKSNVLPNCPDLESKQQLNATAYFRDVWYMVGILYTETPSNKTEEMICMKFTSQILENGYVRQHYTQFMGKVSEEEIKIKTKIDEFHNGKFVSRPVDDEGKLIEPISLIGTTVIDTDYTNYALEHMCVPSNKGLDAYQILNRKPNTVDPNVEPILTKLKLKLQDFALLKKPGCEEA